MLRGPDLNHWKGAVNLAAISCDFMMTKATGGNGYVDDTCDANVQNAIANGKKWGVYHYFSDGFNDGDPIAEADWFVDNCLGYIGKGILCLDWERGGNPDVGNVGKALAWLQHVEARTGVKPLIYMSLSLTTSMDWSSVIAGGYGLWTADYVDDNTPVPNYQMDAGRDPNPHWDGEVNDCMWQFTSTGRLDGYNGNLDLNFFYGTAAAWDAYAGVHTATPPPAPTPDPVATPDPAPAPAPTPDPTPAPAPDPTPAPADPTPAPSNPDVPAPGTVVTPTEPADGGTPVPDKPVANPSPTKAAAAWEALKSLIRLGIFGLPGVLITLLTSNPALGFGYGAPILAALKFIDKYIHENPEINLKGLLPF